MWTDPHLSARMLAHHLDPDVELASYGEEFVARSTAWLTERFRIGPGVHVADFGCGPGLHTLRLARTGAQVTGIDLAARTLAYARRAAEAEQRNIAYVQGDYLRYRSAARFDLVLVVMRDYGALSPADRNRLLHTVRHHLSPGGHLVFDVDAPGAFAKVAEQAVYAPELMDGFWSPQPYFGFLHTFRYEDAHVSLDRYDLVERERTRTFFNWVRYFTPQALAAELDEAGLRTVEVHGDLAGAAYDPDSPSFAVVATPG